MICQYLDASTAHLTAAEMDLASADAATLPRCISHTYGAWVHVPSEPSFEPPGLAECAPNLLAVIKYARARDCNWINFDADADECEGLPTFDWGSPAVPLSDATVAGTDNGAAHEVVS
jgi:hypothetical protein